MSNLRSVSKALAHLGARVAVTDKPADISKAEKVILPGVGSFGDAMNELEKRDLAEPIKSFGKSGKPFFGICLGLQLLFQASQESPGIQGLSLLEGPVNGFPNDMA